MTDDDIPKESILGILHAAIDIEIFGIRYYTALRSAIDNAQGKSLLDYLISAEEKHQLLLEDVFNKQKDSGDDATRPLPMDNLDDDAKLAIFSENLTEVDPASVDETEAIIYGIHVEKKSKLFYENAAKIVDDFEVKETFNELVNFEDEHLRILQRNLDELQHSGRWYGKMDL
jgi:rubrerythrin